MAEVGQAEDDLHRGTSGYADEGFFQAVLRIAEHPSAPPAVRRTLAWLYALERRDDATLLRLAGDMIELAARDDSGVPADVVLGAAVRVRLAAGDVAGARRAFEVLRGRLRKPDDFRVRLMAAHLDAAPR